MEGNVQIPAKPGKRGISRHVQPGHQASRAAIIPGVHDGAVGPTSPLSHILPCLEQRYPEGEPG